MRRAASASHARVNRQRFSVRVIRSRSCRSATSARRWPRSLAGRLRLGRLRRRRPRRRPADGRRSSPPPNVYGSIASAVGGDRVTVTSLIDRSGRRPAQYESTPADAAAVGRATAGGLQRRRLRRLRDAKLLESAGGQPHGDRRRPTLSGLEPTPDASSTSTSGTACRRCRSWPTTLATDLGAADPANADRVPGQRRRRSTPGSTSCMAKVEAIKADAPGRPGRRHRAGAGLPHRRRPGSSTPPRRSSPRRSRRTPTRPPPSSLPADARAVRPDPVEALIVNAQTETPTTDQVRAGGAD